LEPFASGPPSHTFQLCLPPPPFVGKGRRATPLLARESNVIPLLFGTRERTLAGVYSPSAEGLRGRVVVICPPFGGEHIGAYRTGRVLADRLAVQGWDVLRFDYYGTGESAGEGSEVSLAGWVSDARTALEEALDLSGARRATLIGLRLGGLVATEASSARQVDRLILCDPILDAAAYEAGLAAEAGEPAGEEVDLHVGGVPVPGRFRRELRDHTPASPTKTPRHLLVVHVQTFPEPRWLSERFEGGTDATRRSLPDAEPYWTGGGEMGVGTVPVELIGTVVEWLG